MAKFDWHKDMQELIDKYVGDVGIKVDDILIRVDFKLKKYDILFPFYERVTSLLAKIDDAATTILEKDYHQKV